VYERELERSLDELGLDARGVAASASWEPDVTILRAALRRLRGITTHPQVGNLGQNTATRLTKGGVLKTMSEVLDVSARTKMVAAELRREPRICAMIAGVRFWTTRRRRYVPFFRHRSQALCCL
jgi:hypothetical protein